MWSNFLNRGQKAYVVLSTYSDTEIIDKIICEHHTQIISIAKNCKDGNYG